MMKKLALAAAVLATAAAHAANVDSATDPLFVGARVLDFESVSSGWYWGPGRMEPAHELRHGGVEFKLDGADELLIDRDDSVTYNTSGAFLTNGFGASFDRLRIVFSDRVKAFGFNWGTDYPEFWTLRAFDAAGQLLGSRQLPSARDGGEFYGLAFDSEIAYVELFNQDYQFPGPVIERPMYIDNLMLVAVPEPASPALLLAGLGVVGLLAARRRTAR